MIENNGYKISDIVSTSFTGHSGDGKTIFLLSKLPQYQKVIKKLHKYETTNIAKSTSRYKIVGNNPYLTVRKVYDKNGNIIGIVNAVKQTNDGAEVHAPQVRKGMDRGFKIIPSHFSELAKKGLFVAMREGEEWFEIYDNALGWRLEAVELDLSCFNAGVINEKDALAFAKFIRSIFKGCLIVKLGIFNSVWLALELEAAGIDVVHAINSIPHEIMYPKNERKSPLARYGGGCYSGPMIFNRGFPKVSEFRRALQIPMILAGGISNSYHAERYNEIIQSIPHTSWKQNSLGICAGYRIDTENALEITKEGLGKFY